MEYWRVAKVVGSDIRAIFFSNKINVRQKTYWLAQAPALVNRYWNFIVIKILDNISYDIWQFIQKGKIEHFGVERVGVWMMSKGVRFWGIT